MVGGAGDAVGQEAPGEELAGLVEHDRLRQHPRQALEHRTVHLPLGQHRVDDGPRVVHGDQPEQAKRSGLAVDRTRLLDRRARWPNGGLRCHPRVADTGAGRGVARWRGSATLT